MSTTIIPDILDEQECADLIERREAIIDAARLLPASDPAAPNADEEISAALMNQEIGEYLETIASRLATTGSAGAAYVSRIRNYALQSEAYHLSVIEDLTR